jgi:hypothetical protein
MRLRLGEIVAGLGGLALLVSLFLTWYHLEPPDAGNALVVVSLATDGRLTAWGSFAVIDVLLALIALLAIAVPIISTTSRGPAKPIGIQVIGSAIGWIAVLLVVVRLIFPPGDHLGPALGAWIGLAGALVAWIGSWLALRDESAPGATSPDVPRRPAPPATAA